MRMCPCVFICVCVCVCVRVREHTCIWECVHVRVCARENVCPRLILLPLFPPPDLMYNLWNFS